MTHPRTVIAPIALALLLAGCGLASQPSNQISPVANVGSAVGNSPGLPVSPAESAVSTGVLTNTEAQATPAARSSRRRVTTRRANPPGEFGGASSRTTRPSTLPNNGGA